MNDLEVARAVLLVAVAIPLPASIMAAVDGWAALGSDRQGCLAWSAINHDEGKT